MIKLLWSSCFCNCVTSTHMQLRKCLPGYIVDAKIVPNIKTSNSLNDEVINTKYRKNLPHYSTNML